MTAGRPRSSWTSRPWRASSIWAVLLPTAWGTNLDHIGARDGVERLVIDPGDPNAVPPTPPVLESPDDYRKRIVEAARAIGAGVVEAYESAARRADPAIVDVLARRTGPAQAEVTFLAPDSEAEELEAIVLQALEPVRVLTDEVSVSAAALVTVSASVTIYVPSGPDLQVVLEESRRSVARWAASVKRIDRPIYGSELSAAAAVPGVVRVTHDLEDLAASPTLARQVEASVTAQEATWRT